MTTTAPTDDFDADTTDPWAQQWRIPIVSSWWPRWKYEVALVVTPEEETFLRPVAQRPTEEEATVIGSLIDYRMKYYNDSWATRMRERALDVDSTTNTLILGKTESGWRYKLASWDRGPLTWPHRETPADVSALYTPDAAGLVALLDRWKTIGDSVSTDWLQWKRDHADVFAC